ncbi:Transient receptor potential-gamma protein [Orchesella cincta]|uniref:Transient receptor potential-gamma protein n=1 Tax=Orchesella cincta TaxID=48709 RepID=A0A1D2MU55_ORCCI|nr:Transient receptor potential-gamma protein [Orchesella cincta]
MHKEKVQKRKAQQMSERDFRYQNIMRNLVRRYVTTEQRQADNQGVTEDDVNEIKQDISAFRCELLEVLKNSGMNTASVSGLGQVSAHHPIAAVYQITFPQIFHCFL